MTAVSTSGGNDRRGPVIVTGAGGPAGTAVVRHLVAAGEEVLAVDADAGGAGLRLATRAAVVPAASDPNFVDALAALTGGPGTALVVTVAEEIGVLQPAAGRLQDAGIATWLPQAQAVRACLDKWAFARCMADHGVPAPATALPAAGDDPWQVVGAAPTSIVAEGPWVVKPRFGRGSRHVVLADDPASLSAALVLVPDPVVQRRATGREFTADVLVDRSGAVAGSVARWRLETRGGISTRGETFAERAVDEVVAAALAAVGLQGPANVQGFVDGPTVLVTEINPRFSGGLPLSLAAGADLVGEYLRGVRGQPVRADRLVARPGVHMTRYFAEIFEEAGDVPPGSDR